MTWLLRRATRDDLPAIMAIETTTFLTDAWSSHLMSEELAGPHGYYLVAQSEAGGGDASIDGYAGLLAPQGSGQADIQTIAVVDTARRAGLGRMLMLALLDEARRRDAADVFLEVRADNPGAQALYRDLGFESIGMRPNYYQPDGIDAVIMRLELSEGGERT